MTGWQIDVFEGDYVRIITAEEYVNMIDNPDGNNLRILEQEGGKVYQVEGYKYNGKILLVGDNIHAYPPEYLQPWHKDDFDGDVSEADFTNLIGEDYERI